MTPAGIHALRKATALTHAVPGLRLRLTHEGDYLAEVGHDVVPRSEGRPLRMTPCQLRHALVRVVGDAIVGRNVAAFGLPQGTDPVARFGASRASAIVVHPFGLVSGVGAVGPRAVFATTVGEDDVRSLMQREIGHPCVDDLVMNIRRDDELGTSVVSLEGAERTHDSIVELGYRALAACGAEEFDVAWCGAPRPSPRRQP